MIPSHLAHDQLLAVTTKEAPVTVVTGASFMQEQCHRLEVGRAISSGGIGPIDEIFNLLL